MQRCDPDEFEMRRTEAGEHIRAAVFNEIGDVMRRTGLPPMVVMRLLAESIGTVYREMAAAHGGMEPCPCGWRPDEASDVELMATALRVACRRRRGYELGAMQVAGTA